MLLSQNFQTDFPLPVKQAWMLILSIVDAVRISALAGGAKLMLVLGNTLTIIVK
jgi:hypothetical protein